MMPPYAYAAGRLAEERMAEPMRDGEHARLMRMARPVKRGPGHGLWARVGGLLASAGEQPQVLDVPVSRHLRESTL